MTEERGFENPSSALHFQRAHVSAAVWEALLAAKAAGRAGRLPSMLSEAEAGAWSLYAPLLAAGDSPVVFAQIGQSLDGRVATVGGDSRNVSGRDGLAHLHRCRALADAVIVGVGTAVKDDPQLTVRLADGDSPARIVIDPAGRLGNDAVLLRADGSRRLVVQACAKARPSGVEVIRLDERDGRFDPGIIVSELVRRGFRRILVEGGGITIGRFLDAGVVHRLHIGVAPLLIGDGAPGLTTQPSACLADALRPSVQVYGLGSDMIFDCALH